MAKLEKTKATGVIGVIARLVTASRLTGLERVSVRARACGRARARVSIHVRVWPCACEHARTCGRACLPERVRACAYVRVSVPACERAHACQRMAPERHETSGRTCFSFRPAWS